jgi:hypothetical protein
MPSSSVKTLFALAAKNGPGAAPGRIQGGLRPQRALHTYQVNLPVKGSYGAIWQFALGALRAIPFASLDDISFKRDAIGEAGRRGAPAPDLVPDRRPGAAP